MSSTFSLPGIRSIAYLPSRSLPENLSMLAVTKSPIVISATLMSVTISGTPTCECTQSNSNGGQDEEATLTFRSSDDLPQSFIAFVVLDANNRFYLLGTQEEHPLIERLQNLGSCDGEPNTHTYTITQKAMCALIPISVGK